jgi:hypothetical protein
MASKVDFEITRDEDLNLYRGEMTVTIPPINVTRYKADRSDFQYEMRNAVTEIVGEVVDKALKEY